MKTKFTIRFLMILTGVMAVSGLHAAPLDELTVMALGPLDGRAVIKTGDEKMHVLKIGDAIPGTQAIIQQVLTDKVVVEETVENKDASAKRQAIWIFKPTKAGEKSRVQRFDSQGPPKPVIQAPVIKMITPDQKK